MAETIAITASFEAGPIRKSLEYWMRTLRISASVEIAPCNPVLRQLLDPSSLASRNTAGFNVVLFRLEDWIPCAKAGVPGVDNKNPDSALDHAEAAARELVGCLLSSLGRSNVVWIVCICPTSPSANLDALYPGLASKIEAIAVERLKALGHVCWIGSRDLAETYPVAAFSDPVSEEIAQIPFTPHFYASLGTLIARRIWRLKSPPPKMIVLDCDHTLWKGVCSEDGPEGVALDAPHCELQKFMLRQRETGILLCLCSKNQEGDVREVFRCQPAWPLQLKHFTAWRINWLRKSENIRSLAGELRLGLESIIFIDDDPSECAEVRSALPEVLCLTLPAEAERIPKFLAHVWAFDPLALVTEADKNRAAYYRQETVREQFRRVTPSFTDFLASLALEINFEILKPDHFPRAAQLTQRTHQFNLAPNPRSGTDIALLLAEEGWEGFVVRLNDRFGDYGLVGLLLFKAQGKKMVVDTFLLSCRALGRNVEYRMIAWLGELARARGCEGIEFAFVSTGKNQLALEFLSSIPGANRQPQPSGWSYIFPTDIVLAANQNSSPGETSSIARKSANGDSGLESAQEAEARDKLQENRAHDAEILTRIALQYDSAEAILKAVTAGVRQPLRRSGTAVKQAPANEVEARLAGIWKNLLLVDELDMGDNFFDLGGDSFMLVQVEAELYSIFGVTVDLAAWAERADLASLAALVETQMILQLEAGEAERLFQIVSNLSEEEALDRLSESGK